MAEEVEVDDLDVLLHELHSVGMQRPGRLPLPSWRIGATSVSQQYRDIQAHYDRGDAFFALWLDPSRTYSCAYFRSESDDLTTAQAQKIDHVLRKAQLRPGDALLDIGSGWGAMLLRAAQQYGARAHGITLSRQQYEFTRETIRKAGLEKGASVDLLDYRELAASGVAFDRVVSVGMLEHVGRRNLPVFLGVVQRVLKAGGIGVLHFITRAREGPVSPWIRRHIFPGGYIPSWREVIALLPEFGFHLIDAESLRQHYALTLSHWARRFEEKLEEVHALGFDPSFVRMWRLYLRGCACAFRVGTLDLHQLTFTHGTSNSLLLTREHLYRG
jgi:cyclopropane-fatty-acyl-phospholipid synthase